MHKLLLEKLASSGISPQQARRAGLEFIQDPAALKVAPAAPGVVIPYHDPHGKLTKHIRYRYLVDTRTQWERAAGAKPLRYVQPKGTGVEVYLPPLEDTCWHHLFADIEQPILITEGELKALAATEQGFPTIGLGGVWCFGTDLELHPTLKLVKWERRRVYIIYDSDAASNRKVCMAERRLANALGALLAVPYVIRLPPLPDSQKQGLDDFLLKRGPEALTDLIATAHPFEEVEMLHKLNEELMVIMNPSVIVQREDGYLMSRQAMLGVNYAHAYHYDEFIDKHGNVKKQKVLTAKAWIEWPGRSVAKAITFQPGADEITPEGKYNEWKGWPTAPDPAAGVAPWEEFLDYAFQNNPVHRHWFQQWCAYPIQNPGAKLASAVVFYGETEGTGKTFLLVCVKTIYGRYGTLIGEDELYDGRNEWAKNCQFVIGDEVAGEGIEKRGISDKLRSMITRKELRLNPKYVPSYSVPDVVNYGFTTNRPDAFQMNQTDRRYFVHEMNSPPRPPEFYTNIEHWLFNGGTEALFAHFLTYDLTGFNPQGAAPLTEAKMNMKRYSLTDCGVWAHDLISDPSSVLGKHECDLYTSNELLLLYDPEGKKRVTPNYLSKQLKMCGALQLNKGMPVPIGGTSKRLFAVRNMAHWKAAPIKEVEKHYTEQRRERKY